MVSVVVSGLVDQHNDAIPQQNIVCENGKPGWPFSRRSLTKEVLLVKVSVCHLLG